MRSGISFIFITSNVHKFSEVSAMCAPHGIKIVHRKCEYPEIRAESCEEVVSSAIAELSKKVRKPFIIEDSGLFINALNGFPGVYSSYVYKKIGVSGILKLMRGVKDRSARFVSVLGYFDGSKPNIFKGEVKGSIALEARGDGGFGYDPVFIPKGYKFTFAENMTLKQKLSHRRNAVEQFIRYVKDGDV